MAKDFHAKAGLRSMDDGARPFFRMAVQEAEATYKIRARHPIFLDWMQDPATELASWQQNGVRMICKYVFSFLLFSVFAAMSVGLFMSTEHMEHRACTGTGFHKYSQDNPD